MVIPDCSRHLSCVISELLLLPAVQLRAVGAVTAQSVVCMTCCRLFEERDYVLLLVVSPAPSTLLGTVVGREACKEHVVEEPPNKPPSPTICFGLAVALAAAGLPVLHGRQKPL